MIITAYKLWENGVYTGSCPMQFNCDELVGQPYRPVWLVLTGCCDPVNFQLSFRATLGGDYFLTGILVTYKGVAIVLDAVSMEAISTACNQCCDPDPADVIVEGLYNGELPPFPEPNSFLQYIVLREDNGSISALDKFMRDYYGQFSLQYPVNRILYDGGISTYLFYSDGVPFAILDDTMEPYTGVFESNIVGPVEEGEWYVFTVVYNGEALYQLKAETIQDLVNLATELVEYAEKGTWSNIGDEQITLEQTPAITASLMITIETIPTPDTYTSNVAPVLEPFEVYQFDAVLSIGGTSLEGLLTIYATNIDDLLEQVMNESKYSLLGTWSLVNSDTQIQLESSLVTMGELTISAHLFEPVISNEAPTLGGGEWFVLLSTEQGVEQDTVIKADTLAHIMDLIPHSNGFSGYGSYELSGDQIILHPIYPNELALIISAETIPAPHIMTSTIVPVPGVGEHLSMTATFDFDGFQVAGGPEIIAPDLETLITNLTADSFYGNVGTWEAINTDTQVQLTSSWIDQTQFVISVQPD